LRVITIGKSVTVNSSKKIGIFEDFQNADGSVTVPEVLVSYMCGVKKIER
jgi:seryl-tRNA synthetase